MLHPRLTDQNWWRSAVVYQIYPRSFADSNNDGTGDVRGMTDHLDYLEKLGVDAVWVSPWYPSPLHDGGYDVADYKDINPDFGTLADADEFIAQAHARGLRVLIDLVPNHCSSDHPLWHAALAAGPGSPEREMFIFRDGAGENGELPPNNWGAHFGGPAWHRVTEADGTPGQWYCHLFAPEQPDWNWENPRVADMFDDILRFWFDRGVDGFRIDVADAMFKHQEFPDARVDPATGLGTVSKYEGSPIWDMPAMEGLQRRWRTVADEYADSDLGPRVFVSEAYLPGNRRIKYLAEGRLHTSFNFELLESEWSAASMRVVIDQSLAEHATVGAPTTWVLNNHDNIRTVSRFGKDPSGLDFTRGRDRFDPHLGERLARATTDVELGRRRSRAAAMLMLALPGGAYVYQGEELGLEEVEDLPEESLQDPIWLRSNHTIRGRDGCRVPMPWSGTQPPFGFGQDAEPWLPMPAHWSELSVEAQGEDPGSVLELYRTLLDERRRNVALGEGPMEWDESPEQVLSFTRGDLFRCVVNYGPEPVPVADEVIVASADLLVEEDQVLLPQDAAVWLQLD